MSEKNEPSGNQSNPGEGGIEPGARLGWGFLRALSVLPCLVVFERMVLRPLVVGPEGHSFFSASLGVLFVATFMTGATTIRQVVLILATVAAASMLAMSGCSIIWYLFPSTLGYFAGVILSGAAAAGIAFATLRFFGVFLALSNRDEPT